MPFTVMEEESQYVVFVESKATGERHYGPPVDLDEALAIMEWNAPLPWVRQWIVPVPELSDLNLDTEE